MSTKNDFIIPEGELWFVQFKVPEEAVSGDYTQVQIDSGGGMEYKKRIELLKTSSVDLNELGERLYNDYLRRVKMENMLKWIPTYIFLCLFLGFLLYGYRTRNQSPYVFNRYIRTRNFRENG